MPKYYFPNGTPVPFKVVFWLMIANILCWLATLSWGELYAPHHSSGSSVHPFSFRGNAVAFVTPFVGHYLDWGLWIHGLAMGVFFAMLWYYTKKGHAVRVR